MRIGNFLTLLTRPCALGPGHRTAQSRAQRAAGGQNPGPRVCLGQSEGCKPKGAKIGIRSQLSVSVNRPEAHGTKHPNTWDKSLKWSYIPYRARYIPYRARYIPYHARYIPYRARYIPCWHTASQPASVATGPQASAEHTTCRDGALYAEALSGCARSVGCRSDCPGACSLAGPQARRASVPGPNRAQGASDARETVETTEIGRGGRASADSPSAPSNGVRVRLPNGVTPVEGP